MFTTPFCTVISPSDFEAFAVEYSEYCAMLDQLAQEEQDAEADEGCPDCGGESVGRYWCDVCHSTDERLPSGGW